MLLTYPESIALDPPNTKPALTPPIHNGYCRPWKSNMPLPPEPPMNQPPLYSVIQIWPLSAWAAVAASGPSAANATTRAERNRLKSGMVEVSSSAPSIGGRTLERLHAGGKQRQPALDQASPPGKLATT